MGGEGEGLPLQLLVLVHHLVGRQVLLRREDGRKAAARLGALEWKAGNTYTRSTGKDIGVGYPWRTGLIVEPHRPTTLEVTNAADGREYTWHAAGRTHTGETAEVTFTDVGTISLELREKVSASGADARTATGKLHVKYVRREIRDLNDVDREAFFDTSKVLYTLTPKEGLAAYGDRFKDINFFEIGRAHV